MSVSTILTVTSDDVFVSVLRQQLHTEAGALGRMIVARSMDHANALLKVTRLGLVVVHWTGESARYEQLDQLLWTTSVLARRTPVLVIAERYRTDQATMMYRMGVSEYISRTHHIDQLARIFNAYLHPVAIAADQTGVTNGVVDQLKNGWGSNHIAAPMSAQLG